MAMMALGKRSSPDQHKVLQDLQASLLASFLRAHPRLHLVRIEPGLIALRHVPEKELHSSLITYHHVLHTATNSIPCYHTKTVALTPPANVGCVVCG